MSKKFTPWFSGEVKPARPGVYQRLYPFGAVAYSRWNGQNWMLPMQEPFAAEAERIHAVCQSHVEGPKWRGLAQEPKT